MVLTMFEALGAIGGFLGGVGSLLGGATGRGGGGDIAAQQQFSMQQLQMQQAFQREVAQNQIQWKVNDANAAGISPLVALGAPTFNPAGMSLPAVDYGSGGRGADFSQIGSGLARMGQAASDLLKKPTELEKQQIMRSNILFDQQVKSNEMDIALKGANLARMQALAGGNTTMPMVGAPAGGLAGQGDVPPNLVKAEPAKVTSAQGQAPSVEAGPPRPAVAWTRLPNGDIEAQPTSPSAIAQPSLLNPEYLSFFLRNRLFPGERPPERYLPPGAVRFRWYNGAWRPTPYWPGENMR